MYATPRNTVIQGSPDKKGLPISQKIVKTEVPGFLGQIKLTYKVKENLRVHQTTPYRKGLATDSTNKGMFREANTQLEPTNGHDTYI